MRLRWQERIEIHPRPRVGLPHCRASPARGRTADGCFDRAEAPGASGTNWWVDPREDLVVVGTAYSPGAIRWRLRQVINALVYQALVD
jgi:hypothetical protein